MLGSALRYLAKHQSGLASCGADLISKWLLDVSESPRTRLRYGTLLSWVFADMVKQSERVDNPALEVLGAHRNHRRPLPLALQPGQESAFRAALPDGRSWRAARDRALLLVLLDGGLKVQELRDLRTEDYLPDPEMPRLLVAGRSDDRWAPLAASGVTALEDWLALRGAPGLVPDSPWMFPSDRAASPLHSASIYRIADATFRRAGLVLKHQGAEVLRATFAARQFRSGKSLNFVQTCLGHRWPESTEPLRRAALGERPV
jgi:integrase